MSSVIEAQYARPEIMLGHSSFDPIKNAHSIFAEQARVYIVVAPG